MRPQAEPRFNKRVPCRLRVGPSAYGGMVLNVSRKGFFVQTNAQALPGQEIQIDLAGSGNDRIPIGGRVVWRRVVAAHLRSVTQGGVGIRIQSAPESWFHFVADVAKQSEGGGTAMPKAAAPPVVSTVLEPSWRVRVKLDQGSRSRVLVVHGTSEADAKRRALAQVGAGWTILEAEPASAAR